MTSPTTRVAIVGCGYVADYYMATIPAYPDLRVVGVLDRDHSRTHRFATYHSLPVFDSLDQLLSDDVDIVINLTNPDSHDEVTEAALLAGKHVYSEKPLAMTFERAVELVMLSEQRSLQLSCAPCSLLGETAQTIWRALRAGVIGTPRLVYAELDEGLMHRMPFAKWVSEAGAPWPYRDEFAVGTVIEHAGYVVSWLPAMLGPAVSVTGFADTLIPEKPGSSAAGTDFAVAMVRFGSGVVARITCSMIAPHDHSLRITGDGGVISTEDTWFYDSPVWRRRSVNVHSRHQWLPRRRIDLVGSPRRYRYRGTQQMDFARGIADLADAIHEGRRPRLSARYCLHTNEIVMAISQVLRDRAHYTMTTTFEQIEPMPWAS